MHQNQLVTFFLLFFFATSGYSQEIRISSEMPESGGKLIGVWGSQLISYNAVYDLELRILDTAVTMPKVKIVKIGPQVEPAKRIVAIHRFIHEDFIYETYYVFTNNVMPGHPEMAEGYNVVVKRDLRTMEIASQQIINHLDIQVKFVETREDGFYICFAHPVSVRGPSPGPAPSSHEIVPTLIKGFDYDLEPLASLDLTSYKSRINLSLDEILVAEDSRLIVPIVPKLKKDEQVGGRKETIVLLSTSFSGDSTSTTLEYELEEGLHTSHFKIRFDKEDALYKGVFFVNGHRKDAPDGESKYGTIYFEWDETGKNTLTKFVPLMKTDIVSPELMTGSDFDLSKVSRLNLDASLLHFDFLPDGSVLYVADNISIPQFMRITNSKFILCISDKGDLKWSKILPYSSNELYTKAHFFLQNGELHVYTKEFVSNFSTGSYVYNDSRGIASGSNVVISERIIDTDSGTINSHKALMNLSYGRYDFFWPIYNLGADEFLIRYRNPKGNKDKWVTVKY
ncbi:MAG: hypothetical protein ACO1N0_14105 [Fluviicola sp.]